MPMRYVAGVVVLVSLAAAAVVYAGSLDAPAAPTASGGQMYTLEQIYNRINDGTAATKMTPFTEPSSGPTAGTGRTLDEIYALAGQRARVSKTGAGDIADYTEDTNEDGTLQKGVDWPVPRFTDNGNGTVTDNLTGLIWLRNANCTDTVGGINKSDSGGVLSWANALTWSNNLASGFCGLSDDSSAGDWRLPNVLELQSLIHYGFINPAVPNTAGTGQWTEGNPFTGVVLNLYWSATPWAWETNHAWTVSPENGQVWNLEKVQICCYAWPVQGGQ